MTSAWASRARKRESCSILTASPEEPVAERLVVLLREQGGGDQHRDLLPGLHRDERGPHRDLGLAEADVAADEAVHRRGAAHVRDDLLDRAGLIRRLLEGEGRFEAAQEFGLHLERDPRPARPPRLHLQQLRRDVGHLLGRAPPGALPLPAPEPVQRRGLGVDPGVAGDEVQRPDRHVELVAAAYSIRRNSPCMPPTASTSRPA